MADVKRLTIPQAAKRTGMLQQTLRRLCKKGALDGARLEQPFGVIPFWTIPEATIEKWQPRPKGWGPESRVASTKVVRAQAEVRRARKKRKV